MRVITLQHLYGVLFVIVGYDMGGVITNSKREADQSGVKRNAHVKETHW